MIPIKSEAERIIMREAGSILAGIMQEIRRTVRPGISTRDIENLAKELIRVSGAQPAFLGYRGYPACICTSVNEEVVHGIPGDRRLSEGDIVSLDLGVTHKGYYSDIAVTVPVGRVTKHAAKLIETTRRALEEGVRHARPGSYVSDISSAVQQYVERNGCSVVRQFVGHGIGTHLHEEPEIPNFGRPGRGDILQPGMCLAIEPMVNAGSWECDILDDGWTAVTKDKSLSAHFEHTVCVTEGKAEVLTRF